MIYWKEIVCLVAFNIIVVNAPFPKGITVKALEDIAEGSRLQNPIGSQHDHVSHSKNTPHIEKQLQVEHQINLNAKNADITPFAANKKRSFEEALKNEVAKQTQIPHNVKANVISPQFSTDWGDDLMFFATEWDAFPTYLMESHPAIIQHNFATALDGLEHSYHDYYLHGNYFWENNPWLINQPESLGSQSSISVNRAAETQVPEHQNIGESVLADNQPMKNLVETEPTDVSEGTSFNTLASNFGITPQEEARELYKEGQRSNEIVEGSSSLHFNHDPNISQKIRPLKAQDDVIKVLELPLIQKQKNQKLSPEDKFIIEKETLLKKKQSSSKAVLMPIHMIKNSIEKHAKFKKK